MSKGRSYSMRFVAHVKPPTGESGDTCCISRLSSSLSEPKRPRGDGFKMLPSEFRGHRTKLAPGARRNACCVPQNSGIKDGESYAAAHASRRAFLLYFRHV